MEFTPEQRLFAAVIMQAKEDIMTYLTFLKKGRIAPKALSEILEDIPVESCPMVRETLRSNYKDSVKFFNDPNGGFSQYSDIFGVSKPGMAKFRDTMQSLIRSIDEMEDKIKDKRRKDGELFRDCK